MADHLNDPKPKRREVQVRNIKAADPGIAFDLSTTDGEPFGGSLDIQLTVSADGTTNVQTFYSGITINGIVQDHELTIVLPFGDADYELQIEMGAEFSCALSGTINGDVELDPDQDAYLIPKSDVRTGHFKVVFAN